MPSWNVNDQRIPQGRLALFSYLSAAFVVFLLAGFWKLQVVRSEHFADLAEKNGIRSISIIAPRGTMLDREGRVLVDSYPSFSILLLRDNPKAIEKSLPQIEDGLGISKQDLMQQLEAAKAEPKFLPVIIKPAASQADLAFVESHRADLPVLELMMVQRRRYSHGQMLASAIGYVGEVSVQDMEKNPDRYRPGDIVGKAGLEKEYNDQIEGTDGMHRVVVNSVGKVMRTLDNVEAIPGKPIQLTIDSDLQSVAEADFANKEGGLVAMDARTGEVLAMVSRPTFDPNDFAVRIPAQEWARLNSDPETPLLNRAIQAQLAPGSVFKIVMATAMLESKAIPANYTVNCPGYAVFYGRLFHCDHAHGTVNLHKGIVASCDVYFYNVGKQLGIDRIDEYAMGLGLGRRTGIDLPGEEPGLMPSEAWVERVDHHKWYPGSTISVSIGQGAVMVTPIQLARMVAAVANGGTLIPPHLLKDPADLKPESFPISSDTVEQVTDGMWGVVNEPDGTTSGLVKLQDIDFSGKTGTAQIESFDLQNKLGKKLKENGWFVGLAPRRNPEIVVAALVQSGGWGSTSAAPIVRDVVKAYYDKKAGRFQAQPAPQTAGKRPASPPASKTAALVTTAGAPHP
ncbi:MAG TPA: penicillin-binding protein 2 [Candidatus Acidoferrales bacterium]|nr:penicillin-binding protein 2 [Candidatus Acidoferrales bacterium]